MQKILKQYNGGGLYFHHAIDEKPDIDFYHMHAHEHYEFFFLISGKGSFMIEGTKYPLEPGCIFIMRPAETHNILIEPSHPYERIVIEFSESVIRALDPEGRLLNAYNNREFGEKNKYNRKDFPRTLYDYTTDICVYSLPPEYMRFSVITTLINILTHINIVFENKKEERIDMPSNNVAKELMEYINNHLFEDLTLSKLCSHFFLSDSHLERLFKAASGTSIAKYISIKRLLAAHKKIISGTPPTIAALECGYNDYSSFYRAYVKRFGVSPSNRSRKITKQD